MLNQMGKSGRANSQPNTTTGMSAKRKFCLESSPENDNHPGSES
jgi:hypothetical protein